MNIFSQYSSEYSHLPTISMYIYIRIYIYIYYRELDKVILRAVSYIVLLRCRLIYNQHYAPYEHIYIYYIYFDTPGQT